MSFKTSVHGGLLAACSVLVGACSAIGGANSTSETQLASEPATLFEHARLIVGDESEPIEDAAFVIQGTRITAVGKAGEIAAPPDAKTVDLTGKTVMPALVDLHSHIGYENTATGVQDEDNFTRENVIDHLERYGYTGHALTQSLGNDKPGLFDVRYADDPATFVDLRKQSEDPSFTGARYYTIGRGLAWEGTGNPRSSTPYPIFQPLQARLAVRELNAQGIRFVKLWLEDRGGYQIPGEKGPFVLSEPSYTAAIEEAHRLGMKTIAHVKTLKDLKAMVRAGLDAQTHRVDDLPIDDELLGLLKERPNFVNFPVLTPSTRGGSAPRKPGERPAFLKDPLLRAVSCPAFLDEWGRSFEKSKEVASPTGGLQGENTAKLYKAGVTMLLGSHDAGGNRPLAFGSHLELEGYVNWVGMTPKEAIVAGTSASAKFLGVDDHLGILAVGKGADFIVLDANPLDDIRNTRKISDVYLRGRELNREAMAAKWQAACQTASGRTLTQ